MCVPISNRLLDEADHLSTGERRRPVGRLDSVQNDICGEAGATVLFEHAAGDAAERLQLSETLSEGDHGLGVRLPLNDCLCLVDRVASFFRDQCPPAFGVAFENTQPRQLTGYRD